MNIAGILVHAKPGAAEEVALALGRFPGLEIHARTGDNRLVVTIEEEGDIPVSASLAQLHEIGGVLSAAMVYQYSGD